MVLFEDIHWGEPTFLELIEHLAGRIEGVPVLIVAAARTDLLDTRGRTSPAAWPAPCAWTSSL